MSRIALPRPIGPCAGASLTLLALALIATGEAKAGGCAHPHVRTAAQVDAAGPTARFDLLAGLFPPVSEVPEPPAPCNGPGCSRGSDPPLAPPAPMPPPRLDGNAANPAELPPPPAPCGLLVDDETPRPSHHGPSIFHPPR